MRSSHALFCDYFYVAPSRDLLVLCCRGNLYSVWPLLSHSPLGPNMMMTDDWRHVSHTRFLDHNKKPFHTENWEEKLSRFCWKQTAWTRVQKSTEHRPPSRSQTKTKHRSLTEYTCYTSEEYFSNDEKWRIALTRVTVWKHQPSLDDVITWTSRILLVRLITQVKIRWWHM